MHHNVEGMLLVWLTGGNRVVGRRQLTEGLSRFLDNNQKIWGPIKEVDLNLHYSTGAASQIAVTSIC